jgi:hypothetical protein
MPKMSSIVPSASPSSPAVPKRSRVQDFFTRHDPVHARLIFVSDATASREHIWDMSSGLTGEMFNAVATIGPLDCQLVHYKGFGKCFASEWVSDPKRLAGIMSTVKCEAGHTQIGRVLKHILREQAREKVNAAVIISDACEETPYDLYNAAREIAGVPVFMLQEGDVASVTEVYTEIAKITGGAWAKFDANAATKLVELLKAIAVFATGGIKALTNQNTKAAQLLLTQLKK